MTGRNRDARGRAGESRRDGAAHHAANGSVEAFAGVGELTLKGFQRPVPAFNISALKNV